MNNFFGGPNGKSFKIEQIFSTRYGDGNSMQTDLNMGWKSPIPVGSYVVISYGDPNTDDYEYWLRKDMDVDNISYNSTLWEKVYVAEQNRTNGLDYRLIMSMTGFTPRIEVNGKVIDANQLPYLTYDRSNVDRPIITFYLPQSQVLGKLPDIVLNADLLPKVNYNDSDINNPTLEFEIPRSQVLHKADDVVLNADQMPEVILDSSDINNPTLTFKLPQSQRIQLGSITWIHAGENPRMTLDISNINKPILNFWLPVAQVLHQGNTTVLDADKFPYFKIDSTDVDNPILSFWLPQSLILEKKPDIILDADQMPQVDFDDSNINKPNVTFELPQSQIMLQPITTIVGPKIDPSVLLDDLDINKPYLKFTLPRAVKFFYGSLLGERDNSPYIYTDPNGDPIFRDYAVGDYYINAETGFIYQVSTKTDDTECIFDYIACIQQPLPAIDTIQITPYVSGGGQNAPKVTRSFTNTAQTKWKLTFSLPKAPIPSVDVTYVDPCKLDTTTNEMVTNDGAATVTAAIPDEEHMHFHFDIPRGSRMFSDEMLTRVNQTNYHINGALLGDLCINPTDGTVFIQTAQDVWTIQLGSLKGPKGDALHVVKTILIDLNDVAQDTLSDVVEYLVGLGFDETDQTKYTGKLWDRLPNDQNAPFWEDTDNNGLLDTKRLPKDDELISIIYTDTSISPAIDTSYWYYYNKEDGWQRVQLTAGFFSAIMNTYDEANSVNKIYSTNYVNSLIGGNITTNFNRVTYSVDLILAMLTLGDFSDPDIGNPNPPVSSIVHNTLSMDEVIELLAWNSFGAMLVGNDEIGIKWEDWS